MMLKSKSLRDYSLSEDTLRSIPKINLEEFYEDFACLS
jgi:hypothetical protein